MRSFLIDHYRIDIVSHSRVFNPRGVDGSVAEAFEIDLYDIASGRPEPFDWYPNAELHPFSERPQRQTFYWYGKQFQDVLAGFDPTSGARLSREQFRVRIKTRQPIELRKIDIKRGGDPRSRFWASITHSIRKAEAAKRLGITVSDVIEDNIEKLDIPEPLNMRSMAINQAIEALTGEPARITTRIPRGTIANIDCTYDVETASSSAIENGVWVSILDDGAAAGDQICVFRHPLTAIPAGSTVSDVDWQVFFEDENNIDGTEAAARIYAYNSNGQADPDADSAATQFTRGKAGSTIATIASSLLNGADVSRTVDIAADALVEAAIAVGRFSVGITGGTDWLLNDEVFFQAIEDAGTDPATLIVNYTEPLLTPAITNVDPATVQDGTEVVVTGTDFISPQGTGKVEIGDNATYASANLEELTVSAWSDTEITADIVQGALSAGSVWVFVTNDDGEVSNGFEITLVEIAISDVNPDVITDEDTGTTITGTAFESAQGTGKVELGDNSIYSSANLQEQTIESWADTSIGFTAVLGSLTPGTLFVFVTNNTGNISNGFQVTVNSSVLPQSPIPSTPTGSGIGIRLENIYAALSGHNAPKASRSEYWLLGKIGQLQGLNLTSGNKSLESHLIALYEDLSGSKYTGIRSSELILRAIESEM